MAKLCWGGRVGRVAGRWDESKGPVVLVEEES